MKIIIKKSVLLESLNNVSYALSTKNIIPVLSGVKFKLTENGLFLTCSDEDITIEMFIDKTKIEDIKETGNIVIPGKFFIDIIRKIPSEYINIDTDGLKILIHTDTSEYNLNGISADEFPDRNLENTKTPILLEKKLLKTVIGQTSFAVSNQESRPILRGINFKITGSTLECISTDSYRLAKKIVSLQEVYEDVNIVIPGDNLLSLNKVLNDTGNVELHIFSNKVLFKFDDILFQSRLLNGNFPDVTNLIPTEFKIKIACNYDELYSLIDRVSLLTSDKDKNVVRFEAKNTEIKVSSSYAEIGKVEERMVVNKEGEDIILSFSAKYMMEALRSLQSDEIVVLLNEDIKPIVIKDQNNDSLIQLIVPIKTY